jgi:hypothetical protein
MTLLPGLVRASAWTLPILAAAACGQASLSPTSPSDVGRAAATPTGAVISGTVTGISTPMTFSAESSPLATNKPVTVSVVGTNISTTTDSSGRFQLSGVPAGDVQLKFTGSGLDATVTLKAVQAGERIDIRVRLTDTSVRIEAERRDRRGRDDDDDDDDDRDEDEFKGIVSGLTGSCPNVTFTLNGMTVKTNSATRFDDGACPQIRNNIRVEVHGPRQADGTIQAVRIELDD